MNYGPASQEVVGATKLRGLKSGGDDGIRTRGLFHAMEALSQLSYIPTWGRGK